MKKLNLIIIGLLLSGMVYGQYNVGIYNEQAIKDLYQHDDSWMFHIQYEIILHKAYEAHCYADSTTIMNSHWEFIGGEFIDSASYDRSILKSPSIIIKAHNGYYVDYYKIIGPYTHRDPTFLGYIEWLENLIK